MGFYPRHIHLSLCVLPSEHYIIIIKAFRLLG
jgi:hypothetical protein